MNHLFPERLIGRQQLIVDPLAQLDKGGTDATGRTRQPRVECQQSRLQNILQKRSKMSMFNLYLTARNVGITELYQPCDGWQLNTSFLGCLAQLLTPVPWRFPSGYFDTYVFRTAENREATLAALAALSSLTLHSPVSSFCIRPRLRVWQFACFNANEFSFSSTPSRICVILFCSANGGSGITIFSNAARPSVLFRPAPLVKPVLAN